MNPSLGPGVSKLTNRSFVTVPFLNQDPKALNVVQYILESCLLRREKNMRDRDGRLIVDLPPKTVCLLIISRTCLILYRRIHRSSTSRDRNAKSTSISKIEPNVTSYNLMLKAERCQTTLPSWLC